MSLFEIGTSLKGKNLFPEGANYFPLREVPYGMKNHFTTLCGLPCMILHVFLLHTCVYCVMGATQMVCVFRRAGWCELNGLSVSMD